MIHPSQLTHLTAWQSVILLQTGGSILVREYSPYGMELPSEQSFSSFDLSMIEGREAISTDELYHYLIAYYEEFAMEVGN